MDCCLRVLCALGSRSVSSKSSLQLSRESLAFYGDVFVLMEWWNSETWFGLSSRTTVTSLIAIANPFGGAIGDILAPAIVTNAPDATQLLFIVALISTGVVPFVFLVGARPKSPPTRSAEERSEKSESGWKSFKVLLGIEEGLDRREGADFWIIAFVSLICPVTDVDTDAKYSALHRLDWILVSARSTSSVPMN
jgi:FLVCR family MFS transporter 7